MISITTNSKAQSFIGNWAFKSIENQQNISLVQIATSDEMKISEDGTFEYTLKAKNNLEANGTWELINNKLCFKYTSPKDTLRCYFLTKTTEGLVLNEDSINYTFTYKTDLNTRQIPIESESKFWNIIRGLIGITTLILIAFAFSRDRKRINWTLVVKGLLVQLVFAIGILKVPFVATVFETISSGFIKVISFTQAGTNFLFASFITGKIEAPLVNFMVQVLPTIIFFSALTSLFYYLGILQRVVFFFAWMMKKFMKLSGSESLAAVGNIFLGQTEAPLLSLIHI